MLENKFYSKIENYNYNQLIFIRNYLYSKLTNDEKEILNYFINIKLQEG